MKTEVLLKFIKGEATKKEKEDVLAWIYENEANKKQYINLKNAWSLSLYRSVPNNQKAENAWQLFRKKLKRNIILRKAVIYSALKYAAIVILAFCAGLTGEKIFLTKDKVGDIGGTTIIEVPSGQSAEITLPDGSNVYLNSETKLSYSDRFVKDERIVHLEGEGFFEVSEDKKHPFIVETKNLNLCVFGTSFNVEAYNNFPINVTLVEGSLGLNSKQGSRLVRMKPGESVIYDIVKKKISLKKVDTELYTSWRKGIITFRNVQLKDIAKKIERWYNVEIEILSNELKEQRYSGTLLKSKPVDQILEALSLTASFKYEIEYRDSAPSLVKLRKISRN